LFAFEQIVHGLLNEFVKITLAL